MCHRAGSVVVDFSLWMDSSNADSNKLRNILVNQEDFKIKGFDVDRSSIRMSDFPWLPVVLGAVVSVVFVVLVVILVIFTVSKVRRAKLRRRRSFDDDQVSAPYSPTATKRNMLWQEGKPSMPPLDPGAIQRDRYERQRMGMVNRAMSKVAHIDWGMMRKFAQRNGGRQGDMLHRNPANQPNEVWSWTQNG
ncbi:hypothetical protein NP493_1501g01077 [Ridgeia piscesae]|uniref:Uncharacterized protein n=1 Tax=Ridgeia piscesae TaxID=27915 RepID=A0AAD9K2C4_RIDPI|nr:hypothetical protein NP493_1501g01077 [Ridgeia piscesae]